MSGLRPATPSTDPDRVRLEQAIEQARIGRDEGGVPIGAALVADDGTVLGVGRNRRVQQGSAIRHGETDALENAGRLAASVYRRSTMYTTLSPCDMCSGAILLYGIPRVVIGENRTFLGGEDYLRERGVEVVNLDSAECVALMGDFIAEHPEIWYEDIGEERADRPRPHRSRQEDSDPGPNREPAHDGDDHDRHRASRYPPAMAGMPLHEVSQTAQAAWSRLRDRLLLLLGNDVVAMWAHGGTTSVDGPARNGDLDTYVILSRRPDQGSARRIEEAQEMTAHEHGVEWDVWYIVVDDARRSDPPPHAWREGRRDTSWALHRAHWLAGRYVNLHGAEPEEIVTSPTWDEFVGELDRELEHIERHVVEGDTNPYEATYAILNGSRILRSLATQDVVISKRAAGAWALQHLPGRWEAALRAALRSYDGQRTDEDVDLLAAEMSPFVAFVREHLPAPADRPADRPADDLPRWSGY